jgi:hypothetical protein
MDTLAVKLTKININFKSVENSDTYEKGMYVIIPAS